MIFRQCQNGRFIKQFEQISNGNNDILGKTVKLKIASKTLRHTLYIIKLPVQAHY